jgi:hypothetical protein
LSVSHRSLLARGLTIVVLGVAIGCGGGGNKASSSSSSSPSSSSSEANSTAEAAKYEKALADLGDVVARNSDAVEHVATLGEVQSGQSKLREIRDAWFEFDKTVRGLTLPRNVTTQVNNVLTMDSTVIADLDDFNDDLLLPDKYNELTATLNDDVSAFRDQADALAEALGVEGTSGDSSSSSEYSDSSSSRSAGVTITDATATRDAMLEQAQRPGAADASQEPPVRSWVEDLSLDFQGSAVEADATTVSGFVVVASKSKQVGYLAFAVADTSGHCAGGALEFSDDGKSVTRSIAIKDAPAVCTGDAVAEVLGY